MGATRTGALQPVGLGLPAGGPRAHKRHKRVPDISVKEGMKTKCHAQEFSMSALVNVEIGMHLCVIFSKLQADVFSRV